MTATDDFEQSAASLVSPLENGFAITPNDSADLSNVIRELYVGGEGNVTGVLKSGDEITLQNVYAGCRLPYRFKRIKATGTTATALVGAY